MYMSEKLNVNVPSLHVQCLDEGTRGVRGGVGFPEGGWIRRGRDE